MSKQKPSYWATPGLREAPPPNLERIFEAACDHFGMSIEKTRSRTRKWEYVRVRLVFVWLARYAGYTHKEIGSYMSGRDHSTAMHALRRAEDLRQTDREVGKAIHKLKSRIF